MRSARLLALCSVFAAIPATGCYVEARTRAVAPPPPAVEGEVVVEESPPPPPPPVEVEVPPPSPGVEYVWVGGYHRWEGRRYIWVRGRYERRPHAAARWEPAHWEGRGRGHVFVEGRWR
jgi:hypothetical protein